MSTPGETKGLEIQGLLRVWAPQSSFLGRSIGDPHPAARLVKAPTPTPLRRYALRKAFDSFTRRATSTCPKKLFFFSPIMKAAFVWCVFFFFCPFNVPLLTSAFYIALRRSQRTSRATSRDPHHIPSKAVPTKGLAGWLDVGCFDQCWLFACCEECSASLQQEL